MEEIIEILVTKSETEKCPCCFPDLGSFRYLPTVANIPSQSTLGLSLFPGKFSNYAMLVFSFLPALPCLLGPSQMGINPTSNKLSPCED